MTKVVFSQVCLINDMVPPSTKIKIWPERCGYDLKPIPKSGIVFKLGLILSQQKTLTKNNFTSEPILIFVPG